MSLVLLLGISHLCVGRCRRGRLCGPPVCVRELVWKVAVCVDWHRWVHMQIGSVHCKLVASQWLTGLSPLAGLRATLLLQQATLSLLPPTTATSAARAGPVSAARKRPCDAPLAASKRVLQQGRPATASLRPPVIKQAQAAVPAAVASGTGTPPQGKPQMLGRLKSRAAVWASVVTSALVLRWVNQGLDLRWADQPPAPRFMTNHPSALAQPAVTRAAVADLVATGAAREWPSQPTVVSPLGLVPKKGGKFRLIFDGRYVNMHLVVPGFSYESLAHIHEWVRPGDVAFTVDLTAGFHHVAMDQAAWPYLGFAWEGKFYVFTSMPFGLAIAPWAFTTVMTNVIDHFRRQGVRATTYIDDSFWVASSAVELLALQGRVLHLFDRLGLVVNMDKCQLLPCPRNVYLGMIVDLQQGVFVVPEHKLSELRDLLREGLSHRDKFPVRQLARIKGKLAAMSWAFGLAARLFTKAMDADIAHAPAWSSVVSLSAATVAEFEFWQANFVRFNGIQPIWHNAAVDVVLHVDAAGRSADSAGGWGAWLQWEGQHLAAQGTWASAACSAMSSTAQELTACLYAVQSFNNLAGSSLRLAGKAVQLRTDSQNAALALSGGRVYAPDSVPVAQRIFLYCFEHAIRLAPLWVPREQNTVADALSKEVDNHDCMLDPTVFAELHKAWGPFSVDLFASHTTHQLPRYYSRWLTPDTAGVDAFTVDWSTMGLAWANPPYHLLFKTWQYAAECRARLCLLVPVWRTKPWWHLVAPGGLAFAAEVVAARVLRPRRGLMLQVDNLGNRVAKPAVPWAHLALLVHFGADRGTADRLSVTDVLGSN